MAKEEEARLAKANAAGGRLADVQRGNDANALREVLAAAKAAGTDSPTSGDKTHSVS